MKNRIFTRKNSSGTSEKNFCLRILNFGYKKVLNEIFYYYGKNQTSFTGLPLLCFQKVHCSILSRIKLYWALSVFEQYECISYWYAMLEVVLLLARQAPQRLHLTSLLSHFWKYFPTQDIFTLVELIFNVFL